MNQHKTRKTKILISLAVFYFPNLILEVRATSDSLSGEHSDASWLLSVFRETESDIREGEEQLLLF